MVLDDPLYERLLDRLLRVHAHAMPHALRPMVEAQIARDEAMADALARFLLSGEGQGRTAVVICGSGHVSYGFGTVARVRRRLSCDRDRIVLPTVSGELGLVPGERAMAREVEITHDQLRELGRPVADYLHVKPLDP
jgi:uncharacterized iron-regulated protein